ncbi:EAL domain-containing protein [Nitrosomonas sp. Is24]|uniref:EAL domain-containing protein n=1 Tax=Nitrosomonas sp. Is24 TaxID=3080533 RepID=UPI00294B18A5|nr:EAL domain-containing protein [Nitrosomonas sp. Is24]MDV6342297.1 EAL domain-containing protein [Nitrosomonas sp. Is24]
MILAGRSWKHYSFAARIVILLTGVAAIAYTEVLERFDFILYDKIAVLQQYPQDPDIVIVAIDDESFKVLGRWPWSRGVHAELINRLNSIGNKALALDLLLSEPQENDPYADHLLAQAIAAHGNVIFPVAPVFDAHMESLMLVQPLPLFTQQAVLGHVDIELDSDGVARRVYLSAGINAPEWPALGLALTNPAAVRAMQQQVHETVSGQPEHWERAQEALIPYAGESGSFRKISYARVLFDDAVLAGLRDKTVLVGMTATGMGTRFATPLSPLNHQPMTGVEWHANVFSMLTSNRMIYPAPGMITAALSVVWVSAILVILAWVGKNLTIPLLLAFMAAGLFLSGLILELNRVWIPPGATLLGTLSLYPLWNWRRINEFLRTLWMSKAHSNVALESIGDGVIITDASDQVVYINTGTEKILRTRLEQIKGKPLAEILGFDTNVADVPVDQAGKDFAGGSVNKPGMVECVLRTAQGNERTVRITRNQLLDEQKATMGSVIAMTDITDRIELAQQVAHQQSYDALTKLPNRSRLLAQFDSLIQEIANSGKIITVFFVTLDNFKKINDAMGHHAGDKLLKMVSGRLFDAVAPEDMLARWGGDEFVLLSSCLAKEDSAPGMAQKILDAIRQRFEIDGLEVFVSASIGVSFYPDDGLTSETVLERAGTAMYRVKKDGGNHFGLYSAESSVVWTRDQLELERELRAAIKNDELQVLFQPIVHAQSHHIARIEALVRWLHPKRGYLSPSEFIPLAEDIGQIGQLGEIVLRTSCTAAYNLLQLGYPVNVSVNVHPRQLLNRDFPQTILQVLHDTGLPAQSLILEITESAIVNDMERVSKVLEEIRRLNILIALDDFGTGYSSLTLLRELPIDILKIDKSFVRTLDQNRNDLKIVQAIIGLGKNLGLTVIAEGVETERQVKLLLQHACYYHQGYFFSRPIPYEALYELMQHKLYQAGPQ